MQDQGEWIWAPHPSEGYICGQINQTYHNGDVEIFAESGEVSISIYLCFFSTPFLIPLTFLDRHCSEKRRQVDFQSFERFFEEK